MASAFIAVDVQNDFCEDGSLPVEGGNHVAQNIKEHLLHRRNEYTVVVATRDHHVDPGAHFGYPPNYKETWPPHCVAGTKGSELHPALDDLDWDALFYKGQTAAAYSGFEGELLHGEDLDEYLKARNVEEVTIGGLALDYCVRATALDAVKLGYRTRLLLFCTAPVAVDSGKAALEELEAAGVEIAGGLG